MKKRIKLLSVLAVVSILTFSCQKESIIPIIKTPPPVVNGGTYAFVQLPLNAITVSGSATSINGKIVGYLWSLISGPNVPIIYGPSSAITTFEGLVAGTYIFQFAAIDSIGLTGVDTVSIIVNPSLQRIVTLQPANNLYEGLIDSYSPNASLSNTDTQFDITAWTANGTTENQRACLKIDFTGVPPNAVIDSAMLYLYATSVPHGGNNNDANFGTANAGYLQRITNTWPASNNYSWNNQPNFTTSNQVVIPQSTSSNSSATLTVTGLVRDMQQYGNNGFFLQLQNEQPYNIQQFASSFEAHANLHPKLVIWFH